MGRKLWEPTQEQIEAAQITRFIKQVNRSFALDLNGFHELYDWSIQRPEDFWRSFFDFTALIHSGSADRVLANGQSMPGAEWFPDVTLNFAQNLLRHRDRCEAFVFWGEDRIEKHLSYEEVYNLTASLAQALTSFGLSAGDRVAGFVPNMPEAAIAMLAATSQGAIWSSCSPDFGKKGVLDRFGQIKPRVLFTADGYFHKGKIFDSLEKARWLANEIDSIEKVIVIPYTCDSPAIESIPGAVLITEIFDRFSPGEIDFKQLPFSHPVYIMFSSGTTGKPKCIVHGAGGTLLEHLKELTLHTDVTRTDHIFYQSTCGWMMWNWHISSLALGATLLLYDGAPFLHDGKILFELAEKEQMTIFGTNARYISAVEKSGLVPQQSFNLSALKRILSTGSPLLPQNFNFVYEQVKEDVCLSSISGGTDIIGCFALGCPTLPVHRGELQCRSLGLKVEVFNDSGHAVSEEHGELVCSSPFPSMPVCFWNDPDGTRYRNAYFSRFPDIWHHGDYVELTAHKGMVFYGRSDAVLNPGGIRIGTAEIYRQVEQIDEIEESVVIGQSWEGDVRVILFVKMQPGHHLTSELKDLISITIRKNASPFHVPKKVIEVSDIPRTRSGKIVELAVRDVVAGHPITNQEALLNPEALDLFRDLTELNS